MSRPAHVGAWVLAVMAAACHGPTAPTPPPPLLLSCPASVAAVSFDGAAVAVSFPAPTVAGGEGAVTTTCVPTAGQLFNVGSTAVLCTARDARQQTATCGFGVTVTKAPKLSATTFVAFGDSITEGVSSTCNRTLAGMSFAETMLVLPKASNDLWTYPNTLQAQLQSAYPAQAPRVVNRGQGGEMLSDGVSRLTTVLTQDMPQVLLLQEGANDVNQGTPASSIAASLGSMVAQAKQRGQYVFLGTLLPQRALGIQGSCRGFGADNVALANDRIRSVAKSENVPLVDLYEAFGGVPGDLIGPDGLHPTVAGYQRIADTFFAAIRQRLGN